MGQGPLAGLRFVELAGIGPVPFAGMVLADLGADGVRVAGPASVPLEGPLARGRPLVTIDLKADAGRDAVLALVARADILVEGFRPGVMERLGLGPDACLAANPRLVYGRMTGWGQDGPLAPRAGHDIDYVALAGALGSFARRGQAPVPPLNLVGDYGGGAMLLVAGVLAGVIEAGRSGRGQVVDAAMVDGVALLMTMVYGFLASGRWDPEPGTNVIDTGAPFYDVYETAGGGYVAVGALEPRFFEALLAGLGLDPAGLPAQYDRASWPELRRALAAAFRSRTRDEWAAVFEGADACVAPVLRLDEAPAHPHLRHRSTFVEVDGVVQPAPAPRFSRTPPAPPVSPSSPAPEAVLEAWGLAPDEVARLRSLGVVGPG